MSYHPSILRAVVFTTLVLLSCQDAARGRLDTSTHVPQIEFAIRSLDGDSTQPSDSVWSQNDNRDSVGIVISDGKGLTLSTVSIELLTERSVEGDPVRPPPADPRVVTWKTFTNVTVDSLPGVSRGRQLLTLRPSVMQQEVHDQSSDRWIRSIRVQIQFDGAEVARSFDLLWD